MKLTVIGRDPRQAEIVIQNEYISNYHAEIIQLDNGDIFIVDKSTNGTFVNGERLIPGKETPVRRGDRVSFAGLDLYLDWSLIPPVRIPDGVRQVRSIGSHHMNTIIVNGGGVSRFHATMMEMEDGKWYICDHSTNGTTVNGKSIPKNKYVRIRPGDEISCGGIPIENPVRRNGKGWLYFGISVAAVCAVVLVVWGVLSLRKPLSDEQLIAMYDNSVVLMEYKYHFEVRCGTLPINGLPNPDSKDPVTGRYMAALYDKFVVIDDYIIEYDGTNAMEGTATGFFVGEGGTIVTNRHVAMPWEMENVDYGTSIVTVQKAAEDLYRDKLTGIYEAGYSEALPYISQVEVYGVLDEMKIIPNGKYRNAAINCVMTAVSSENEDLALFKILSDRLPYNVTPVPVSRIKANEPDKGTHILTIGFPGGEDLLDNPETEVIQAHTASGSISRNDNRYTFGFDAAALPGASGSPVFDEYGNLMGVLNSGIFLTQGFNYGIRSEYLASLLKQSGITK